MRILYGVPVSPFVRKVRFVLAAKGLDYRLEPVIPMAPPPDYREKSPLGKVPCYEDDEVILPDSSVIAAYLERIAPEPALYPADAAEFGRVLWLEEYADTKLIDEIEPIFHERFIQARIHKQAPDEAVVSRQWNEQLPPVFDYLESQLSDTKALVGADLTLADLAVTAPFAGLFLLGFEIDAQRWPKLSGYLAHQLAIPFIASLIDDERAAWKAFG